MIVCQCAGLTLDDLNEKGPGDAGKDCGGCLPILGALGLVPCPLCDEMLVKVVPGYNQLTLAICNECAPPYSTRRTNT